MSVTVDHEPLAVSELNLQTVGQVFTHLQRENRLVVQVLLDGETPKAHELGLLRQTRLNGHTLFSTGTPSSSKPPTRASWRSKSSTRSSSRSTSPSR
jgi:hypothetical protein